MKSTRQLVHYLVRAAGQDANLLLNVGPKPDGTIQQEFVDRLEAMGDWLDANGETIYATRGGPIAPQTWGVSTQSNNTLYLHLLEIPEPTDGWTTLPGTNDLDVGHLTLFKDSTEVPHQHNTSGDLQVKAASD